MKELGTKVSELRQKLGLTQEQFAEAIHSNRTTVSKWESDKVSQQPTINDIITICNVYGTDMDYFINDFRKSPLNFLDMVDENAPKTIVYTGLKEVSNAFKNYAKEINSIIDAFATYECKTYGFDEWLQGKNSFICLLDQKTHAIVGIHDYGMYMPQAVDFLLSSDYLPIKMKQAYARPSILQRIIKDVQTIFTRELKNITDDADSLGKKPLILLEQVGHKNYIGWSLHEEKTVLIFDFNSYQIENALILVGSDDGTEKLTDKHDYKIYTLSEGLSDMLGFSVQTTSWSDDESKVDTITQLLEEEEKNTYLNAISVLNQSRNKDIGHIEEIANLEAKTQRFERLLKLQAPKHLIQTQYDQMKKLTNTIMESLK